MRWSWKSILVSALMIVIGLGAAGLGMKWLWPSVTDRRPELVDIPPLAPITLSSMIIAPAAIAVSAIGDAIESAAPRDFTGKPDIPPTPFVSNAEIAWSVSRGVFAVTGGPEGLSVSAPVSGSLRATGQMMNQAGGPPGSPGGLPGGFGPPSGFPGFPGPPGGLVGPPGGFPSPLGPPGSSSRAAPQTQEQRTLDERVDVAGNIVLTARPNLLPEWRLEPNLTAQVTIADASLMFMGTRLSLSRDVKPMIERTINEQVSALQARVRNDPSLEHAVRREWGNMCRSISLAKAAAGMPDVWLELRPTRAFAAQPSIDQSTLALTFGIQADTRIVPSETKPNCPFPARLELVSQMDQGRINIAVPIDIPFAEINRLLEQQLRGKTFPEDKSGGFVATVRGVNLAASGDRLLLSVRAKASETKSWFGLGAEATIHVWGRPELDRERQIIRFDDIAVDVESEAALGLLGTAARAAVPHLEKMLAHHAVVDLQPLAADARRNIDAAIAEFEKNVSGVRTGVAMTSLRLAGIEFDSKTVRVMGEAAGTVRIEISALPRF